MTSIFKDGNQRQALEALTNKMRHVVENVVTDKFRKDLELDRVMLDQNPGVYAWYVYDYGTHLMPLSDTKAVLEFQREWINGLASVESTYADSDRLYVLNARTGDIRRVIEFKKEKNLVERLLHTAI